ncbi:MAG TPA: ABC transporter substrate-binding protein [Acidimicrobiales bacterium]|nr:ABC transporter substrate-binding protein [Acidimicrobiales bacterium]
MLTSAASAASGTSGYSTNTTSYCKPGATPITFWGWVPGIYRVVDLFNQTHPSICVDFVTKVGGSGEYVPLLNALKANSGAPDVAEIEFDVLPEFEVLHYTVDLSKYGAGMYKNDFVPWAWGEVTQGSHIWAMPDDGGSMGLLVNAVGLAKYGITTPPATWAQFAADAATVHKANANVFMGDFAAGDGQWVLSLMQQAGAWPFVWNGGSNVTINFTGPKQMAFANYWQNLVNEGLIDHANDPFTSSSPFFEGLNNGLYLTWPTSAWGPSYFASYVTSKSAGDWLQWPLPGSATSSGNWGGSTYPVFSESKHPAQAAIFTEWLCGSQAAWNIEVTPPSLLFPNFKAELSNPAMLKETIPMLKGGASLFGAPAKSAPAIPPISWPPFMVYYLNSTTAWASKFFAGKETIPQYFQFLQSTMVSYAKSQGFTVST